jgi:hypothetical protein
MLKQIYVEQLPDIYKTIVKLYPEKLQLPWPNLHSANSCAMILKKTGCAMASFYPVGYVLFVQLLN